MGAGLQVKKRKKTSRNVSFSKEEGGKEEPLVRERQPHG